jgi:putative restriction endonuclease
MPTRATRDKLPGMDTAAERAVRDAAMTWLDGRPPTTRVDYEYLASFEFDGTRIPLKDYSRGIRHPKGMRGALSISTTFTPPGRTPPYDDLIGADGLQRYKYRGTDPHHSENVALRQARELGLPLIWFVAVERGIYEPIYPVWVIDEEPANHQFVLALDAAQKFLPTGDAAPADVRSYALSLTKVRLHQRAFRARVLLAYGGKCCICRLKHTELLDAAHIIADGLPNGQPVVPNGLSLCKIHHAAFDHRILGIRPDLSLHVRSDVLEEVDGWMLKGGIQEIHNRSLEVVPSARSAKPDPNRLESRYADFLTS